MTETLKNLMHAKADATDFALPDVDALVASGTRRMRRRRAMAGLGGVAALALVGGIAVTTLGGDDPAPKDVAAVDPLPAGAKVTWAIDSVLHTPDSGTDVGHVINAYVRTEVGYVFADPAGKVFSFIDGKVTEVGQTTKKPHMVGDPDAALAGWVDFSGAKPAFVVLDQGTGQVTRNDSHTSSDMSELADEADPAYFYAIDDGVAYWRDSRGAVAVTLDTGDVQVINPDALNGFDIIDAESGVVAFSPQDDYIKFGRTFATADVHLSEYIGSTGAFSPDGKYLAVDADDPSVFDTSTGERIAMPGRPFGTVYEWLDATHVVMISADEAADQAVANIEVCTVGTAVTCETVAEDLGTFTALSGHIALPTGESTDD